jgi:ornithine cyclodeaminase
MPRIYAEVEVDRGLMELNVGVLEVVEGAFAEHHRGASTLPPEACLHWESPSGGAARSIAMHAHLAGPPERVGMKLINAATDNPGRGLARASGVIALFDPLTAEIIDLMPAAKISATRTAAVSTLAARRLAVPSARRLALIGAGALARAHSSLLISELGLSELVVFDADPERAKKLADAERGIEGATVARSAEEAVRGADVIVAATTVTEPYVELGWLAPGSLFLNVSLDDLCSEALLRVERLYVDDWQMVLSDSQRLLGKMGRRGQVIAPGSTPLRGARTVSGELGALFCGDVAGRSDESERIVVNPFGLAISDIALAGAVVGAIEVDEGARG